MVSGATASVVGGILMAGGLSGVASAAGIGYAEPGQIGFQVGVTPIANEIHGFHDKILLPIIVVICVFVAALLLVCVYRFNENAHPVPSKSTHNTLLEVAWTVVPVLLLVIIAVPSFRLLTHQLVIPTADVTVKATGKQWYWSYSYPKDQAGGFGYDSALLTDDQLKPGDLHLLSVDNELVVPVNKVIAVQVTGADVIHSFIVQSLGVRIDAVPGRLNETWFKADREGVYYGQCSKLCGKDHAYMPIEVRVVSQEAYEAWLQDAKKKYASNGDARFASVANSSPVAR